MSGQTAISDTFVDLEARSAHLVAELNHMADEIEALEQASPHKADGTPSFVGVSQQLRMRAQQTREGRFQVLVMGEFKNGKSTLLNAMLSSNTLPQKKIEATAVITRIAYGEPPRVQVVFNDGRPDEVISLEQFKREYELQVPDVAGNNTSSLQMENGALPGEPLSEQEARQAAFDRFSHVRHAIVYSAIEICRHGVELVDSPGLGAGETRRMRTESYLDTADAIVFVMNALKFPSGDERHVLENVLWPRGKRNIFFVVNYWNMVGESSLDPEQDISQVKQVIYNYLPRFCHVDGRDLSDERIFLINAIGALKSRLGLASAATLEESNVPRFEQALVSFLARERSAISFGNAALTARSSAEAAQRHINILLANVHKPVEQLEAERAALLPKLRQMKNIRNYIASELQKQAHTLQEQLVGSLIAHIEQLRKPDVLKAEVDKFDLGPIMNGLVYFQMLADQFRKEKDRKFNEKLKRTVGPQIQTLLEKRLASWQMAVQTTKTRTITEQLGSYLKEQAADYEAILRDVEMQLGASSGEIDGNARMNEWLAPPVDIRSPQDGRFDITVGGVAGDLTPFVVSIAADIATDVTLHTTLHFLPFVGTAISGVLIVIREKGARDKVKAAIVEGLDQGLRSLVKEEEAKIRQHITQGFDKLEGTICSSIDHDIDSLEGQINAVIEQAKLHQGLADEEVARLRRGETQIAASLRAIEEEARFATA